MVIPRKELDISFKDIFYGMALFLLPFRKSANIYRWQGKSAVISLSVRSVFDSLLTSLALPRGSEIIMSGINIPDMIYIAEHHNLKVVPLDLNMKDLSININSLNKSVNHNTKMILIAHLYGAIIDISPLSNLASKRKDILIVEDCAQSFRGVEEVFQIKSFVSLKMYSFGMIKTSTALGGAMVFSQNKSLLKKIIKVQENWEYQSNRDYLKKLIKAIFLKSLLSRIGITIFILMCKLLNVAYDQAIVNLSRGFKDGELLQQLRKNPSHVLIKMVKYRLDNFNPLFFVKRAYQVNVIKNLLDKSIEVAGINNPSYSNWLFTVRAQNPEIMLRKLREIGLDATCNSTQLKPIFTKPFKKNSCTRYMENAVYIPLPYYLKKEFIITIADIINKSENP